MFKLVCVPPAINENTCFSTALPAECVLIHFLSCASLTGDDMSLQMGCLARFPLQNIIEVSALCQTLLASEASFKRPFVSSPASKTQARIFQHNKEDLIINLKS